MGLSTIAGQSAMVLCTSKTCSLSVSNRSLGGLSNQKSGWKFLRCHMSPRLETEIEKEYYSHSAAVDLEGNEPRAHCLIPLISV